jgi:hypothetical protein
LGCVFFVFTFFLVRAPTWGRRAFFFILFYFLAQYICFRGLILTLDRSIDRAEPKKHALRLCALAGMSMSMSMGTCDSLQGTAPDAPTLLFSILPFPTQCRAPWSPPSPLLPLILLLLILSYFHAYEKKKTGKVWHALEPSERARWEDKARAAQAEHRRRYPDWRFRPGNGKVCFCFGVLLYSIFFSPYILFLFWGRFFWRRGCELRLFLRCLGVARCAAQQLLFVFSCLVSGTSRSLSVPIRPSD